jgi:site-specific DNA-cytosine methylase
VTPYYDDGRGIVKLRVLVACEFSGIVRDAFAARGHDAWSCDLLPTERPGNHIQGDVLTVLTDGWDLMIAHPPCIHLAVSGARWFKGKQAEQKEALEFIRILLAAPIDRIALENPVGIISTRIRKPNQIIQPFWFGDSIQKATCLWLKNLKPLTPTKIVDRGLIYVDPRGNKHGGVHTMRAKIAYSPLMPLPRNEERWKIRSRTFSGIAEAMAEQWGESMIAVRRLAQEELAL